MMALGILMEKMMFERQGTCHFHVLKYSGIIKCHLCEALFSGKDKIKRTREHLIILHKMICDRKNKSYERVRRQYLMKPDFKAECKYCFKMFNYTDLYSLKNHLVKYHENEFCKCQEDSNDVKKTVICNTCNKSYKVNDFKPSRHLIQYMRVHCGEGYKNIDGTESEPPRKDDLLKRVVRNEKWLRDVSALVLLIDQTISSITNAENTSKLTTGNVMNGTTPQYQDGTNEQGTQTTSGKKRKKAYINNDSTSDDEDDIKVATKKWKNEKARREYSRSKLNERKNEKAAFKIRPNLLLRRCK